MEPASDQSDSETDSNRPPTPKFTTGRFRALLTIRPFVIGCSIAILLLLIILSYLNLIFGILMLGLIVMALLYVYPSNILKTFAQANGYDYLPEGFVDSQTGLIFSIGYGPDFKDIVYGLYGDWPFFLFIYSYSMGQEEDSKRYSRTVLHLNFQAELPALVLRKDNVLQMVVSEGESLKANGYNEKLDLEGDFDKHFQVFIRPDTQEEVLSVLTPDVMELVMQFEKCEIEITADGKLYVYYHSVVRHNQELINAYSIVEALTPKISAYINREQELHPDIKVDS
jgi:hypothetical protein